MSDRKTEKRRFHEFDHELWDRSILKKKTNGGEGETMPFSPIGYLGQVSQKKKRQKLISAEKANREGTGPFHALSSIHECSIHICSK